MSHEDAARVRHCQPRVHHIWMSDSLPCIICVVLHLCDGRRDRVAREIFVDQQLYSYSFLSSFFLTLVNFTLKYNLIFHRKKVVLRSVLYMPVIGQYLRRLTQQSVKLNAERGLLSLSEDIGKHNKSRCKEHGRDLL